MDSHRARSATQRSCCRPVWHPVRRPAIPGRATSSGAPGAEPLVRRHTCPMRRRPQLIPWKAAGRVTEEQASADEVVQATGWVFNNETGDTLTLAEFVATGDSEVAVYVDRFGLGDDERRPAPARRDRLRHRPHDVRLHPALRHRLSPATSTPASSSAAARPSPASARSTGCARSRSPTAARCASPTTPPTSRSATSRCSTASATTPWPSSTRRCASSAPAGRSPSTSGRGRALDPFVLPVGAVVRGLFRAPGIGPWLTPQALRHPPRLAGQPARPAPGDRPDPGPPDATSSCGATRLATPSSGASSTPRPSTSTFINRNHWWLVATVV